MWLYINAMFQFRQKSSQSALHTVVECMWLRHEFIRITGPLWRETTSNCNGPVMITSMLPLMLAWKKNKKK